MQPIGSSHHFRQRTLKNEKEFHQKNSTYFNHDTKTLNDAAVKHRNDFKHVAPRLTWTWNVSFRMTQKNESRFYSGLIATSLAIAADRPLSLVIGATTYAALSCFGVHENGAEMAALMAANAFSTLGCDLDPTETS